MGSRAQGHLCSGDERFQRDLEAYAKAGELCQPASPIVTQPDVGRERLAASGGWDGIRRHGHVNRLLGYRLEDGVDIDATQQLAAHPWAHRCDVIRELAQADPS